ncbi:MAG: trypsin-like serine protease [Proteobacteria bacterium]|nr:MAG: trypsin-like serine protease [Pseudomonadota bacterium]
MNGYTFAAFSLALSLGAGCSKPPQFVSPQSKASADSTCKPKQSLNITNGVVNADKKLPYVVALDLGGGLCTSTLISKAKNNFYILTANHCTDGRKPEQVKVTIEGKTYTASALEGHPLFQTKKDPSNSFAHYSGFDIAIVHFKGAITAKTAELAKVETTVGAPVFLAGFGGQIAGYDNNGPINRPTDGKSRYACNDVSKVYPWSYGKKGSYDMDGIIEIDGIYGTEETRANGGNGENGAHWYGDSGSPLFQSNSPIKSCVNDSLLGKVLGVAANNNKKDDKLYVNGYSSVNHPCIRTWLAKQLAISAWGNAGENMMAANSCGFTLKDPVLPYPVEREEDKVPVPDPVPVPKPEEPKEDPKIDLPEDGVDKDKKDDSDELEPSDHEDKDSKTDKENEKDSKSDNCG